MNQVSKPIQTMASHEIAELTGKAHKNVIRDIEVMFSQLKVEPSTFEGIRVVRGKNYKCYNLPRRECEILITGYDTARRAAVIDRWFELEANQALPTTGNPIIDALVSTQLQLNQQQELLGEMQSATKFVAEQVVGIGSSVKDVQTQVLDQNAKLAKIERKTTMVNQPLPGYSTLGNAVRTFFPEVSKGALETMVARAGLEGEQYTYFVEQGSKMDTTLQYKESELKKIRKDVLKNAKQVSKLFWEHPLNPRFRLTK